MHNQPIRDILRSSTALHNNIKEEEEEEGGKEEEVWRKEFASY